MTLKDLDLQNLIRHWSFASR